MEATLKDYWKYFIYWILPVTFGSIRPLSTEDINFLGGGSYGKALFVLALIAASLCFFVSFIFCALQNKNNKDRKYLIGFINALIAWVFFSLYKVSIDYFLAY